MSDFLQMTVAEKTQLPVFQIAPAALAQRDAALSSAALIGKVENAAQNESATRAHIELKRISAGFEKERKKLKEPILEAGRQLDRVVNTELQEIEKEIGRISALSAAFQLAEQRRVREEEELQRKELERIEQARQAEIARIAREQAEVERKAREAQEAAEREARNAKNKEQAAAAEASRKLAQEQARAAGVSRAAALAEQQRADDAANAARMAEAKPIQATRSSGQVVKTDWEITVTNPYDVAKFYPDCCKVEILTGAVKERIKAGLAIDKNFTMKGIEFKAKLTTGVRAGTQQAIEV